MFAVEEVMVAGMIELMEVKQFEVAAFACVCNGGTGDGDDVIVFESG